MGNGILDGIDLPAGGGDSMFVNKFDQGQNRFRILNKPTVGYVWWPESGGKPERVANTTDIPSGIDAKYFWFIPVIIDDEVKLLEIKQKSVMQQLLALEGNKEWGDLTKYDVTVTRSGENLDTTYTVVPNPKAQLKTDVADRWVEIKKRYKPSELFNGGSVLELAEGQSQTQDNEGLPF